MRLTGLFSCQVRGALWASFQLLRWGGVRNWSLCSRGELREGEGTQKAIVE